VQRDNRAAAFQALREMVLNSVVSEHSKRNYAKALDEVFALCEARKQPLSRALLMGYRAAMLEKKLSASTVNVRLSAVRKLIGEAQRNGIIGAEEAANLAGVPNLSQKGTRVGMLARRTNVDVRAVGIAVLEQRKPFEDCRGRNAVESRKHPSITQDTDIVEWCLDRSEQIANCGFGSIHRRHP
jgi:hypothetical protein